MIIVFQGVGAHSALVFDYRGVGHSLDTHSEGVQQQPALGVHNNPLPALPWGTVPQGEVHRLQVLLGGLLKGSLHRADLA